MAQDDAHSWDLRETREGNVPGDEESFDRKCEEWERRDWMAWLEENLSFPFQAERKEDDDDAYFTDVADHEPFRLGHKMTVLALEGDNYRYGIIVKAKEEGKIGHVPLSDLEVTSQSEKNYWPVREYVVWFANR